MLFVEAMTSEEQLRKACADLDKPLLYNMATSGKTPYLSAQEMQDMGFAACIYPGVVLTTAIPVVQQMLRNLRETGDIKSIMNQNTTFQEFFDLLGMDQVKELENRYVVDESRRAGY